MAIFKLTFASLAAAAVAEAAQYGVPIDPGYGAAMAPRDACTQLPELCTGAVMMQGLATTLTYLCPKTTEGPSTVHVTVTQTTTVTAVPGQSSGPEVPPKDAPTSNEPTTTTTIHSTQIMTKTITVSRKKDSSSSAPTPGPTSFTSVPNATTSQPVETKPLPNPDTSTIPTFTSDWLHPVSTTPHPASKNSTSTFIKPSVIIFTGAPGTAVGSHGASAKPTMRGNSTGYAFPTPHQLRDIDPSTSAEPAKGVAGKMSMGVEMVMVLGLVSAVVVHVAGLV
ncbi:hypothetical protein FB567DRAFT_339444 [Paraphoma chrysanthemicola]|uniref:Uncharacterized protein n=1 Tax=Paraphoma chrysanthemicola TaxID=798071 RepID=A0A8K0RAD2_9PLEO|nr:hypothetical protein FB567DRAFT_339444 [Paraphoma chrysanthemicola]